MNFLWGIISIIFLNYRISHCEDEVHVDEPKVEETKIEEPQIALDDKIDVLSVEEDKVISKTGESHEFQAEVDRMMKMIINSLYANKEIFLRELISNANDAIEKIQFVSLQNPEQLSTYADIGIWIRVDEAARTLTIRDSGIGMTREELVKNLGTLAKSGTSDFLKTFQNNSSNATELSSLIGQFGVGFYSSFLVADSVTVVSKHNDDDQYIWQSDSTKFSISKDSRGNTLGRGTQVTLHMREETSEFMDSQKLTECIKKYSEFVDPKIYFWTSLEAEKEPKKTSTPGGPEVTVSEQESATKDKRFGYKIMNDMKPIWLRKPKEVLKEEYDAFYSTLSKEKSSPTLTLHFSAEGDFTFKALVFVPTDLPPNLYGSSDDKLVSNLKLYVHRVYVQPIKLPRFLRFLSGVIDSDDLPLNVGREMLQQGQVINSMLKRLTRRYLDHLKKLNDSEFLKFYEKFGVTLKVQLMEDNFNQNRLTRLLRFQSSNHASALTSLTDYVSRMKKNQLEIYYIAGSDRQELEKSPLVQKLLRRNFEVIFMVDPVDEYMMFHMQDFDGKRFQNVAKDGFKLPKGERIIKRYAKLEQEYTPLFNWLTAGVYKDKVTSVRVSERTDSAPCLLISDRYGYSGNMNRLIRSQAFHKSTEDESFKARDKKHLEVNPKHPMVKEMLRLVGEDKESEKAKELAQSCMNIASLSSGYVIDNNLEMAQLLESLTVRSLGMDPATVTETIQQETEEEIEEEMEDAEDARKVESGEFKPKENTEPSDDDDSDKAQTESKEEEKSSEETAKDEL